MIDYTDLKEQVFNAMPYSQVRTDLFASQVRMNKHALVVVLRMLRGEGRVEYLGRHWVPELGTLRAFWRKK